MFLQHWFAIVLMILLVVGSLSQDRRLLDQVVSIDRNRELTLIDAFREALTTTAMPGGIVTYRSCATPDKFKLEAGATTLQAMLEIIKAKGAGHEWQLDNGVIVMLPRNTAPTLLAISLPSFVTNTEVTTNQALNLLLNLPQVREGLFQLKAELKTELGISPLKRDKSTVSKETEKRFRLSLRNCKVIDVLNAIARSHGGAVWSYEESRCNTRNLIKMSFVAQ